MSGEERNRAREKGSYRVLQGLTILSLEPDRFSEVTAKSQVLSTNVHPAKFRVTNSCNKAVIQDPRAIVNQCLHLLAPILLRTKCFSATSHLARLDLKLLVGKPINRGRRIPLGINFAQVVFCLYCNG